MKQLSQYFVGLSLLAIVFLSACNNDNEGPRPNPDENIPGEEVQGTYIFNEGSFGAGDASLSFYNAEDGQVSHQVYSQKNPDYSLGDGANDMQQYGSKLYFTMTESNQVVVAASADVEHLAAIQVDQPRSLAFYEDKAFVTSYSNAVFVIDTASLQIISEIEVGRTPEAITVAEDKLYVANSGWQDYVFNGGVHDHTVSVIDPNTLQEEERIDVAENVTQVLYDGNGHVLVGAADIFNNTDFSLEKPGYLHVIHTNDHHVETLDYGVQLMATAPDQPVYVVSAKDGAPALYTCSPSFDLQATNYFTGIDAYYALGVADDTGNVWVGDAHDYTRPGTVSFWEKGSGTVESFEVKVSPKAFVFAK